MDADEDGSVADAEADAWADATCRMLAATVELARDGARLALIEPAASISFPPGTGGLSTLRLTCDTSAPLDPPIAGRTTVTFADPSFEERIGWREIVAVGAGTMLDTGGLPPSSPSAKLTAYPAELIAAPLDIRSASIVVTPGPAGSAGPTASVGSGPGGAPSGAPLQGGAVPGGAGDIPDIFRTADLTPLVLLASLATAIAIGAGHALTPGHGKTLMAAYLVGSRGTAVHAVGLGLSVAVSHTLGILVLALVVLGAGSILPPEVVYRVTPVIAAVSIVAIGGWMVAGEVRRRARRTHEVAQEQDHEHEHEHEQEQEHEHDHGGVRHSHLPPTGSTLTWRGLFVLGLAGGLVPSTSALLILLSSIAAGRPAFGLVLVVAFGLGMAAVMAGVGLAMILARGRLDRLPRTSALGRLAATAPLVASVAVLGLGLVLTWQAVAAAPTL